MSGAWNPLRLSIFDSTAETVKVALAYKHVFIGLLELKNHGMHPVYCLLEGFKVGRYRDNVLVESTNLELMILEVTRDVLLVRLGINELLELSHIKFIPDSYHPLVPAHQLLLKLDP